MNKDIFYRYDHYLLERKVPELDFIEFLDELTSLNKSVESFVTDIANLLYNSIKQSKIAEPTEIIEPNIESELEQSLADNPLYTSYKSHSQQNLSQFILSKFKQRLFQKDGHNNETHVIQNYIHSWLEKKLALNITQDSRFNSLDVLKEVIERTEMLHDFYIYLIENIPSEWLLDKEKQWVDINISSSKLLDCIRLYDKDYLDHYIRSLPLKSKENTWQYVEEVTNGSDYMLLNHEFGFISSVLIKKDISLWIKFWDNLKLPVIQDCAFLSSVNFKPQQYLQLVSKLTDESTIVKSDLNVLLFIIAKNYFEASCQFTERFSIYEDPKRRNKENEQVFDRGIVVQKEWLQEKKKNYESIILSLKKKLTKSDIEDWIFSYKPRVINSQFKANDIYNSEIKLLTEAYKEESSELPNLDSQSFNLQKFNFYIELVKQKQDKAFASDLLKAMIGFISSDKFYWDRTYTEPYWPALKGLSFILSQQDNVILKAKELINLFKINHQGWNSAKIDFSPLVKESFVYSGVALLFENESAFKDKSDKEFFFKELLTHILIQDRYSHIDNSEYYQMPLYLLSLVSNQILSDVKEYYEQELIGNYDNLFSLLTILSSNNEPICDNSKSLMKERLDKEFLLEKRKLTNRDQTKKAQNLNDMIEALKLENESG